MLQETLNEFLRRECTQFELPGVGGAILKSNAGSFHVAGIHQFDEATVAKGDAVYIRRQILERGLSVTNRLAVHDPLTLPDFCRYLGEEGCLA